MKKSTIIKYLELQLETENKYNEKTQQVIDLKAKRDVEMDDAQYDEYDKEIDFTYLEREDYTEQLEQIEQKLKTARKEDRKGFLEAMEEYSKTNPVEQNTITMIRTTGPSAAQIRCEEIYSGKA